MCSWLLVLKCNKCFRYHRQGIEERKINNLIFSLGRLFSLLFMADDIHTSSELSEPLSPSSQHNWSHKVSISNCLLRFLPLLLLYSCMCLQIKMHRILRYPFVSSGLCKLPEHLLTLLTHTHTHTASSRNRSVDPKLYFECIFGTI